MAEIKILSETKLICGGFIYVRSKLPVNGKTYWECQKLQSTLDDHAHVPNQEECEAEIIKYSLKRKAEDQPQLPPAQILRTEMAGLSDGVLSQLPNRDNLKKSMRKVRRKNLPPNPKTLNDFGTLPDRYQKTLTGEHFLIYDSLDDDSVNEGRVVVFSTRRNLELLARSDCWFLDGTFKVCPTIFTQVFTILGTCKQHDAHDTVAIPFVYALLSSKKTVQYATVLRAVQSSFNEHRIVCEPAKIMTDFEKSIINACQEVYPNCPLTTYNDPDDRSLKMYSHMMLALAFVPLAEVPRIFSLLKNDAPEDLLPILEYFEKNYVVGVIARGRRRGILPRYPPEIWNQHQAALTGSHKTNNVSEGWHNRFQLVIGKHHPDLYSALGEIQKEQADAEIMIAELSLGRKVRALPKRKWRDFQKRIMSITAEFNTYQPLQFLRAIAHNIVL
ncbi:hypothetical protein AGLY_016223 [Aphis glycines]|uniref:MULE transposase domain-containing protein n=1 Tax=Aphis glycines TaxID=307491 RepID=A0A6G0SYV6_APHGL|nr:hypothetical protein AGLY_016223 [Aphis glycines]